VHERDVLRDVILLDLDEFGASDRAQHLMRPKLH
jgi:hypothetical protein